MVLDYQYYINGNQIMYNKCSYLIAVTLNKLDASEYKQALGCKRYTISVGSINQ